MKIIVLGSTGMLGRYVEKYLSKEFELISINRDKLDASKSDIDKIKNCFIENNLNEGDVVINCIGTIKPRVDQLGDLNAIIVNSVFPRYLSEVAKDLKLKVIHPTTDCVYTGSKGNYDEDDVYDVNDVYGMSKAMGEVKEVCIVRTSIIGEEINNGRSLVEWVKSESGNSIFGYTNHYWNGVTCLQFAKICKHIIDNNLFWEGIRHLHSNKLNKYELVSLINDIYSLNISISMKETDLPCDRSITSKYTFEDFNIPSLRTQIFEMKEFYKELK
jgi:dTDP-4-dehydrorhamnose reductase